MDRILQYEEINSENKIINHEFICICPNSSNTVLTQKKKIDPKGLTLVGSEPKKSLNYNFWVKAY
jgi:hypothetical protein